MVVAAASERAHPVNNKPDRGTTLTIREVSHRFDLEGQPLPVLDRISLRIGRGEFVALLGPSGCGKSTLLRLVAGLDAPSAGGLFVEGEAIEGPDPSRIVVAPDCGLKYLPRDIAFGKMKAMADGAKLVRAKLVG